MTPAELQANIDGKVKIRELYEKANLKQQDLMMATQTARLMNMINLRGKNMILSEDVQPDGCRTFQWDKPAEYEEEVNPEEKMQKIQAYMQARIAAVKHNG
jgi:hypothetical protein